MQVKDPRAAPNNLFKSQQIAQLLHNPPACVISNSVKETEMLVHASDFDTQFRLATTANTHLHLVPRALVVMRELFIGHANITLVGSKPMVEMHLQGVAPRQTLSIPGCPQ